MVLVDTSVWIRFFADQPPYGGQLQELLRRRQVAGHDLVFGELLMGDPGGLRALVANYERLPRAAGVPHEDVVAFVHHRRLHGRGIGWIDVHLLASAVAGNHQLWTADARFASIARQLGIAY